MGGLCWEGRWKLWISSRSNGVGRACYLVLFPGPGMLRVGDMGGLMRAGESGGYLHEPLVCKEHLHATMGISVCDNLWYRWLCINDAMSSDECI
jgi:hypothetical protein